MYATTANCHSKLVTAAYLSIPENSIPAKFSWSKAFIVCSLWTGNAITLSLHSDSCGQVMQLQYHYTVTVCGQLMQLHYHYTVQSAVTMLFHKTTTEPWQNQLWLQQIQYPAVFFVQNLVPAKILAGYTGFEYTANLKFLLLVFTFGATLQLK